MMFYNINSKIPLFYAFLCFFTRLLWRYNIIILDRIKNGVNALKIAFLFFIISPCKESPEARSNNKDRSRT